MHSFSHDTTTRHTAKGTDGRTDGHKSHINIAFQYALPTRGKNKTRLVRMIEYHAWPLFVMESGGANCALAEGRPDP